MNEDLMNLNLNLENIKKQLFIMNMLKAYELKVIHNVDFEEVGKILNGE